MTTGETGRTRARDRTRAQMWAESALAAHPHRLELRGSPDDLSWPRICAHCGQPATERIIVTKPFRPLPRSHGRSAGGLRAYRIGSARVPFCAGCAATHRATVQKPSTAKKLRALVFNPLLIPIVASAWMATIASPDTWAAPLEPSALAVEWGLFAFFVAVSAWSAFLLWWTTRPSRLDPQTDVTRACDFSEDVSASFERERRIYTMRNQAFADAMTTQNADRIWTSEDQSRSTKVGLVVAVLTLVALVAIVGLLKLMGV